MADEAPDIQPQESDIAQQAATQSMDQSVNTPLQPQPQPVLKPPTPTTGYGMPALITMIGQMIHPTATLQPGQMPRSPSRLDAFEQFLGNFTASLGAGLAASGTGPGANIRGAAAAMNQPHNAAMQQYGLQQQQQEQQARIAAQQASTAAQTQATSQSGQLFPTQLATEQTNLQLLQRRLGFTDPDTFAKSVSSVTPTSMNADEQVQWNNALREASLKGDFTPLTTVANAIARNRAISGRAGEATWTPDNGSNTGYARVQYDKSGKIIAVQKNMQPPFAVPKTTQTQELRQDASGNWVVVPITSTTSFGKGGGAKTNGGTSSGPSAKTVIGPGGDPLQGKLPPEVSKAFDDYQSSQSRYNIMQQNFDDATKNNDQQAMLSLLANHLGMTMGLAKGARINQAIISEAEKSRPWLQGMKSKFDSDGYLSGVTLTPLQMQQMVALGKNRLNEDLRKFQTTQNFYKSQNPGTSGTKNDPVTDLVNKYKPAGVQ